MRARKDYGELEWKCSLMRCIITVYVITCTKNVMAVRSPLKNDYVAAVVEYSPVTLETPRKTVLGNLAQYEKIIENASQFNVDIIVFPEAGLTTVDIVADDRNTAKKYLIDVPSPQSLARPCSNTSSDEVLQRLSCAARKNKMYVALNVAEISPCIDDNDERCPQDGAYFYNTNIVFDREGTVIARYRKFNLFEEKTNNSPKQADLCTFETDFGVTFGMFICFDIMFAEPSLRLVREKHVTDVIFSAAWFSELPLLTALSVQAGWAYSMDVNLLAAVYDQVEIRAGGSGIYAGRRGPLVTFMPRKTSSKLLIATVRKKGVGDSATCPSDEESQRTDKEKPNSQASILPIDGSDDAPRDTKMTYICDVSLPSFEVQPLQCDHASADDRRTIRNRFSYKNGSHFSCLVEVVWRSTMLYDADDYENYEMAAFSGERNFGTASRNFVELCGLIWRTNNQAEKESSDFCVANFRNSNVEIESVKIQMKSGNVSSIAIPSALDQSVYPLDVSLFNFRTSFVQEEGLELYSAEMNLIEPTTDLRTFAIYKLPADPASEHKTPQ